MHGLKSMTNMTVVHQKKKDPHSHTGVLSQSADAQNSPPLYYTIIFRYWSNGCIKILDTEVMPA